MRNKTNKVLPACKQCGNPVNKPEAQFCSKPCYGKFTKRPIDQVDKNGPIPEHMPHLGPCWIWTAYIRPNGYGEIQHGRGIGAEQVHRVSYRINIGPIPDGKFVLHKCDNPACVRPYHLFLGDAGINYRDCVFKNRDNPAKKLSDDQVREIRRLSHSMTQVALAKLYSVRVGHIFRIVHRMRRDRVR